MKQLTLAGFAMLAFSCLRALAGTEMSNTPDPKDMKGMSQMAPRPESHMYVAAYGGAQWSTSYGNNRQTITPAPGFGTNETTTTIHSNWGGVGGVKFGYMFDSQPVCDWMNLRWQPVVEADALYIGNNSHATSFAGSGSEEKFSTNSGDFFLNGILRLPNKTPVTPYFGAGAGLQYITTHGTLWGPRNVMFGTGLDTSDLDFAAQALAGFDFRLCDHISLFTEYKFIDALGTDGHSNNLPADNTYRFKPDQIQQHLITAGVKYDF
jgi:opacity protein-like surface antigen